MAEYYVRAFNPKYWSDIIEKEKLSGEAITLDLRAKDNDWSIFGIGSIKKDDYDLESAVLHLLTNNFVKDEQGLYFLVITLDDLVTSKLDTISEEEVTEYFKARHYNIQEIDYNKMNYGMDLMCKKVNDTSSTVYSYSLKDIYEIMKKHKKDLCYFLKTKAGQKKRNNLEALLKNYGDFSFAFE